MTTKERSKVDLYDRLLEIDARLSARGIPALSPFWKRECRRFLRSGTRRWIIRSGRRAGKSLTLIKIALTIALFGDWTIPPGELALVPFLSVERREAASRIRQLVAALDILGESYDKRDDEIELKSRPVLFRVVTASVKAVSGFTSIAVFCDEVAKWKDEQSGANPAAEVFASVVPTMSTIASARIVLASSPWSETDFHASLYDQGEDDAQCVSFCESWIGNPTLTPEGTRKDAPSELVWLREYCARPSASSASLISKDELVFLTRQDASRLPPIPGAEHVIGLDVGLRNDRTAIVVARKELRAQPDGSIREFLVVVAIEHLVPGLLKRISIEDVVEAVSKIARVYPGTVYADQHYFDAVAPRLRDLGLRVEEVQMTPSAISEGVTALQARISEQSIEMVKHAELRKELLQAVVVHGQGGRITCRAPEGRRGMHDDLLAALQIVNRADIFQKLRACDGEIVVKYGRVNFDPTSGIEVERTRFYRRTESGALVEREPPFGSRPFIEYAVASVARGEWTPAIERWARELGIEPRPDVEPQRLDPQNATLTDLDAGPRFVGVVAPTNENTIEARMRRATHRMKL